MQPNQNINETANQSPLARYLPTWNSLRTHPTPAWFQQAKFGSDTHWSVYSVPAYRDAHFGQDITCSRAIGTLKTCTVVHVFVKSTKVFQQGVPTGGTAGQVVRGPGWSRN